MSNYEIEFLVSQRDRIKKNLKNHSEKLNEFPSLPDGRVPEEIRNTDIYKFHKIEYDKYFKELRLFNSNLTKKQKKEMAKYK